MPHARLHELREILADLSLHEADLAEGDDTVVDQLAEFKQAANRVNTVNEPWVTEWLSAEHLKAAMLHTAAKTNRRKEQADGTDRIFNEQNRAAIVIRFNSWVAECRSRFDAYEQSARTAADVAEWRADLELFRQDPVRNP